MRNGGHDLERLYRAHGACVLRRARSILGDDADAQEALQDVFTALLGDPGSLDGVRSVVAWLYQATTHRCLKVLRGRRTGARLLAQAGPGDGAPAVGARGEAAAELRDLLARLPEEEAAAIVYHHLDGMSHGEVAELLGCSPRKVGYLLERARGALLREEASP